MARKGCWNAWALACTVGSLAASASAQQVGVASEQGVRDAQLEEVVVSAAGYEQALAEAPATISVITAEDLQGKYYRDVSDALQDVPGLSIEGGASSKLESTAVTIRGMSESYVLFLVDGKPLGDSSEAYYNGYGGAAKINQLPPMSAIERIEVIRGPMSSLYGSSALGGVVNIITKKRAQQQWSGTLTVDTVQQQAAQAGATWQAAYYLSGPLSERLGLTLFGSKFRRAEDEIKNGYAKKDRSETAARLHWTLSEAHSLELEAGLSRNKNLRTRERTGTNQDMANRRPHFGLTHELRWGQGGHTRSFITHEKVSVVNASYRSSYEALNANSKTVVPLARHMLTVGADVKQEKTRHMASRFPGSVKTDLSRWQAALFAEDEFAFNDALSLTGGLRLDRNQHYGTEMTPRLYAVYRLGGQWSLKGGVSGGYKTPTLKQADDNIVEIAARGAAWDKGNTRLRPERSANYEIGAVWADAQRSLGLTYYNTRFKDKISTKRICTSPASAPNCHYNGEVRQRINQYVNLDRAKLQGLELSASAPLGALLLKASYTWSDSEVTSGARLGRPLNNLPRHMFNLGADWPVNARWKTWIKAKYKGKTLEDGQSQYPAYTMVDLGMNYEIGARLQVFGGIYNLLDKQITREEFGKALDGRRWHIGLTAQF
ncbi:TonB-dependent receptor [Allofranklinella schreckenbergeri]|uniref:TonB-dependent receptor n=1 Tax=Allofranklinella schreckenbergeri TaxID=1076744 RepID=A0A3M6QDK3_9BURK|nr:TonB-dependent receptor [Allofranklinella schreckenbergeri]RMX00965.1 TonB-dependent receptor [Allofranklinella schreckenbergeri]RRD44413.1 TonB-dependent receptor [Comamonadaceae bacterium OH3737_COT-264]